MITIKTNAFFHILFLGKTFFIEDCSIHLSFDINEVTFYSNKRTNYNYF